MYKYVDERKGIIVVRRENEDIDSLIKRFKKKVNKSGILKELKQHSAFEKPSVKRKRKEKEARLRLQKDLMKQEKTKRRFGKDERN